MESFIVASHSLIGCQHIFKQMMTRKETKLIKKVLTEQVLYNNVLYMTTEYVSLNIKHLDEKFINFLSSGVY